MTYAELVQKRKDYELQIPGLINPSKIDNGILDSGCFLEPWAKWHCSIPAKVLVVGQDWGGIDYYNRNSGRDNNNNPTCRNLMELFKAIHIDIGTPEAPEPGIGLHLTNIIPFIRTGQMQGQLNKILNQGFINHFASEFTNPLITIIKPEIIITIGKAATQVYFLYLIFLFTLKK